jgi:hypothetical protein
MFEDVHVTSFHGVIVISSAMDTNYFLPAKLFYQPVFSDLNSGSGIVWPSMNDQVTLTRHP